MSLHLSGERYDYVYYPLTREVCPQNFPDVAVVKFRLPCGTMIDHDMIRNIIEDKLGIERDLEKYFS
jgi:hypothetical protein